MRPEEIPGDNLLVDTNVFSRLAQGDPAWDEYRPFVVGRFMWLSFVTVGETLAGAYSAGWGQPRLNAISQAMKAYGVLSINSQVAETYARLWADLKKSGLLIGDNDLWIAATALAQDPPLPLLTRDSDFDRVAKVSALLVVRPDVADA